MDEHPHKISEIVKEMAEYLLRNPEEVPSSEAAHVALCFAHVAWNESVGLDGARDGFRIVWESLETDNPELWNELKSNDILAMIDELVEYKEARYSDDQRRILACGYVNGNIRAEWVPAAAPGVDSKWEMFLYGLVRTGQREQAIRFLRRTQGLSRKEATKLVADAAAKLGIA